jgi:hypothetical protein
MALGPGTPVHDLRTALRSKIRLALSARSTSKLATKPDSVTRETEMPGLGLTTAGMRRTPEPSAGMIYRLPKGKTTG